MYWPFILLKTLSPLATLVASNWWPQASWKITPPHPFPIITGKWPLGHSLAPSIRIHFLAFSLANFMKSNSSVKNFQPFCEPGPSNLVSIFPFSEAIEFKNTLPYSLCFLNNLPSLFIIVISEVFTKKPPITRTILLS